MLPFPAATPASRKYHEDLEPEGMVVVPGELSHPPSRSGQARDLGLGQEGVLGPSEH